MEFTFVLLMIFSFVSTVWHLSQAEKVSKKKRSLEEIIQEMDRDFLKSAVSVAPYAARASSQKVLNPTNPSQLQHTVQQMDKEFPKSDISVVRYDAMHALAAPSKVANPTDRLQQILQQMDADFLKSDTSVALFAEMHGTISHDPEIKLPDAALQDAVGKQDVDVFERDSSWVGQFCQQFDDDDDFGYRRKCVRFRDEVELIP